MKKYDRDTFINKFEFKGDRRLFYPMTMETKCNSLFTRNFKSIMKLPTFSKQDVTNYKESVTYDVKHTQELKRMLDLPDMSERTNSSHFDWSTTDSLGIILVDKFYIYDFNKGHTEVGEYQDIYPNTIKFSNEHLLFSVGSNGGKIDVFNADTNLKMSSINTRVTSTFTSMLWKGKSIITGTSNGFIEFNDIRSWFTSVKFKINNGIKSIVQLDESEFVISGNNGDVQIFSLLTNSVRLTLSQHTDSVNGFVVPSPNCIITGGKDKNLCSWNTISGKCLHTIDTGSPVLEVGWNPLTKELMTAQDFDVNGRYLISFWDVELNKKRNLETPHFYPITSLNVSKDGNYFCASSLSETLTFYEVIQNSKQTKVKHKRDTNLLKEIR
jgi:WD40 repeat protein